MGNYEVSDQKFEASPKDVTARIYSDRWDLLCSLETEDLDPEKLIDLLIEMCDSVAKQTHNRVLTYKLHNIKHLITPHTKLPDSDTESDSDSDSDADADADADAATDLRHSRQRRKIIDAAILKKKRIALMQGILNSMSANEYHAILTSYISYQKYLQSLQRDKSNRSRQVKIKKNLLDSDGRAARKVLIDTLVINLEHLTHDISELSTVSSETVTEVGEGIHPHSSHDATGIAADFITPLTGILGILQVGYEANNNNAILRNSFSEFQQAIKSLDKDTIIRLYEQNPHDPDAQINSVKEYAKNQLSKHGFFKVLYSGVMYSIFFGMVLSFFAPLAYIYTLVGFGISAYAANKYRVNMLKKIDTFINQPQLDLITVDVLNAAMRNSLERKPKLRKPEILNEINITTANRALTHITRFSSLINAAALTVLPFVSGVIASINSMFTWRSIRIYLKTLQENPETALQGSLAVDEETPSLLYYYGSNLIRSYIFNVKGLDAMQLELEAADIPLKRETGIKAIIRTILAPLGIMYTAQAQSVLRTLYDGNNPAAVELLEKVRLDCKHSYLEKELAKYLKKNKSRLNISNTLEEIRTKHLNNDSADLNLLMHHYLQDNTIFNLKTAVFITGLTTGTSWALLTLGIGLTFFLPAAPLFVIAAISMVLVSLVTSYVAARIEANKARALLSSCSVADSSDLLKRCNFPHVKQFLKNSAHHTKAPVHEAHKNSYTKLLRLHKRSKPSNADNLSAFTDVCEYLTSSATKKYISGIEYKTVITPERSVSLYEVNNINIAEGLSREQSILTAPVNPHDAFDLHQGTEHSWQIFIAYMQQIESKECIFSLGDEDLENRAQQFIAALLLEFSTGDAFLCNIKFSFENLATAQAIFQALTKTELHINNEYYNRRALDRIRAHFGLIEINGTLQSLNTMNKVMLHPYVTQAHMQNQNIFDPYITALCVQNALEFSQPYQAEPFSRRDTGNAQPENLNSRPGSPSLLQNVLQNVRKAWHNLVDLVQPLPEVITLDAAKLNCCDELKDSILLCFKARKNSIERNLLQAQRDENQDQIALLYTAIDELERDFAIFKQACIDPNSIDKQISKTALQYCEKRYWLGNSSDARKLLMPSTQEKEAIAQLRLTAHKLLRIQ